MPEDEDADVIDMGDGTVHVIPIMGRQHVLSKDCWCHPEQDKLEPNLYIHNLEN